MTLARRTFLRVAGVSALGAAAAACSGSASSPVMSSPPPPASVTRSTAPSVPAGPPDWNALRSKLSGALLRTDSDGFDAAKHAFNPLFDTRNPAAVAQCRSAADVQACVSAAAGRVSIAARSGGHSYAGYSVPQGGLVVDVGALSQVDVEGSQAVIGAGAKLGDIYTALGRAGRCLPAGSCPTVGIAGLTLGGGIGVLARKYGLTCDHVTSMNVVTADGQGRTVSADAEPDLFWALRGGGGGNFAIVTSFTFDTEPAPDVTVFSLKFPSGAANDVLDAWQRWLPGAPPELWSNLVVSGGSPPQVRVGGCYVGGSSALNSLLSSLISQAGANPTSKTVRGMSCAAAMKYFAGSSSRQTFVASSRIIDDPVDAAKITGLATGHAGTDLLIDGLGGKVAEPAPADTAFWHRKALASIQIYAPATAANRDSVTKSVGDIVTGLADAGAGGGYVNYIDPNLPDWSKAYYGDNAARLNQVAQKYDPNGVFRFAQGIRT